MEFQHFSPSRYLRSVGWTVVVCMVIVAIAATLARATLNLSAALVSKPDLAVYMLRPDVTKATLLRGDDITRDYLAITEEGQSELIQLVRHNRQWKIGHSERLHEGQIEN